ncbi:hypothetical protein Hypma_007384 [Hypsizygus marmoreus]|uniref:F-box domain-containing protein n=1 Tax=Hypsizygus marmoreus TaxID=39966 RepID=A0A369JR24_HYPMA|nr:hypothetical protein Hypma_007384 [Hypsizygus marmoreus]
MPEDTATASSFPLTFYSPTCPEQPLPTAALIKVFSYCSPGDLLHLLVTCRTFNYILSNQDSIWKHARELFQPAIPAPPASSCRESVLASVLFGGGRCTQCQGLTDRVPCSVVPIVRFCSDRCPKQIDGHKKTLLKGPSTSCLILAEDVPMFLDPDFTQHLASFSWMDSNRQPRRCFIRSQLRTEVLAFKRVSTSPAGLSDLLDEWDERALALAAKVQEFEGLTHWLEEYRQTQKPQGAGIINGNKLFLHRIAGNLEYRHLELSPILVRHVNAYIRDARVMSNLAWLSIREQVLWDIKTRVFPGNEDGTAPGWGVKCVVCPLSISQKFQNRDTYFAHMQAMHPWLIKQAPVLNQLAAHRPADVYYSDEAPRRDSRMIMLQRPSLRFYIDLRVTQLMDLGRRAFRHIL